MTGETFQQRLAAERERAKQIPFRVLVWGPDPHSGTPAGKKRLELREALRTQTPPYEAYFSEELCLPGENLLAEELVQAKAADFIVCIRESPGSVAEFHSFSANPIIRTKMLTWCNKDHQEGFSSQGLGQMLADALDSVRSYDKVDLQSCRVIKETLRRADALRHLKYHDSMYRDGA